MAAFDRPNQLDRQRDDVHVTAEQLLDLASTPGAITEAGLRNDVDVAIEYLSSWLRGSGAVAINGLMEDAATAEIARSQVWQWIRAGKVTPELVRAIAAEVSGDDRARELFERVALSGEDLVEFLTLPAYEELP
jgi:malate synthase